MSMRYPCYPLIVHDPYFSIWSSTDHPAESYTTHWTGKDNFLFARALVDGRYLALLGFIKKTDELMTLTDRQVLPTRTIYTFEDGGVRIVMTFLTPALLHDLDILSRPVSYVTFDVTSADGKEHDVSISFAVSGICAVDSPYDEISWMTNEFGGLKVLSAGSMSQKVLGKKGDGICIDWGYIHLAGEKDSGLEFTTAGCFDALNYFSKNNGRLPEQELTYHSAAGRSLNGLIGASSFKVRDTAAVSRRFMVAYDDIRSIEFLERRLRGYWSVRIPTFTELLRRANAEYEELRERCINFDDMLMADAEKTGGPEYAAICAGAYRQSIAAHKLVADIDGTPLFFSKENFSNGCICTVDVTYPSEPLYLLMQPALAKGMLLPVMTYANSNLWPYPYAPHDLGTYPLANGQVYCMGPDQGDDCRMPVEECGNMLLLAGAVGLLNGDLEFFKQYKTTLLSWAEYLLETGYDPENQLCTDDFAGHLAHNANLSIKAILALAAYGKLCTLTGYAAEGSSFTAKAREFAAEWLTSADDGEHYRLAFDQPGSWSQKYNLVWDRLLGLGIFPDSVAEKELACYKKVQNTYGVPLDSRESYTKLDWIFWSAILTGKQEDFRALMLPVYRWLQESVTRVPMSDWYWTDGEGAKRGFQARSVVGGIFIPMLASEEMRKKYLALCSCR